jgi:pSer/pThr/pTyr-binding forkhead associated (FHA) protein
MKKIGIFKGSDRLKDVDLQHGTTSIGRDDDNVITIQDPGVSGHHAKIINILNLSYIQDMGSANGTYVNGKRIDKHTLYDGDSIQVGGHKLVFVSDENKRPEAAPARTVEEESDETVTISREEFEEYFARHASENKAEGTVGTAAASPANSTLQGTVSATATIPDPTRHAEEIAVAPARPEIKKPRPAQDAGAVAAHRPVSGPAITERIGDSGARASTHTHPQPIRHRTVTTRPHRSGEPTGRPSHVQARVSTRKNQVQSGTGNHTGAAEKNLEQMIEQPTLPRWFIAVSSIAILCMIVFFIYILK